MNLYAFTVGVCLFAIILLQLLILVSFLLD